MAKAATRRLKVFQAQFGFHDSVVAAPSQVAALRAWGTRQNLFAEGQARVTDDPKAVEAALAHPETPLRRAVGATGPFELAPSSLPHVPDGPKRSAKGGKPRPPPDRSALTAAEAALGQLEDDRRDELAHLQRRQAALEAEAAEAEGRYDTSRKAAQGRQAAALKAYRKAGGEG